ncbi:MAG: glycoside hydrolase family 5 protein [Eubacteriales bacterium]
MLIIIGGLFGWRAYESQFEIEMNKGINIGNALDAPKDVAWDVEMDIEYFDEIKEAGFDTVRLPVRFSDYVDEDYVLDEDFMQEVDSYINYALELGLLIVLDFHHFEEIMQEPYVYLETYCRIWEQLSERYEDYPKELVFELLNEPHSNMAAEIWNDFLEKGIDIIREKNPTRKIIVGTSFYYNIETIYELELPKDNHLIVSFHYYEPNDFAFQGNIYHAGYEHLSGITWTGTTDELAYLEAQFQMVADWAKNQNVDVFLGEFGVTQEAPEESRIKWTEAVVKEAEKQGFSWAYWELASGFGIYDAETKVWDSEMLEVLITH